MPFFQKKYLPEISLLVLAIGLYFNTLHHGFVLDDQMVLTQNSFVKKGLAGIPAIFAHDTFAGYERLAGQENSLPGGRYRPFSLAVFAVLYSIFGENAVVYHALAILLYALTGVLLYGLLRKIFNENKPKASLAWAAAALFLAHPVHTEVVANVKGCDEQLALLFGLGAGWLVFKAFDFPQKRGLPLAGVLFFLACLCKENAVLLGFLLPLALWLFRDISLSKAVKQALPLFVALVAFLLVRLAATATDPSAALMSADPLNNSFLVWSGSAWLPCSASVRLASIIFSLGYQLRLLAFPYPLTHDYYHFPLKSFTEGSVWASAILLVLALGYGLQGLRQRWKNASGSGHARFARFGILFTLLTMGLTSNIFFPVGALLAERFLYLPSVGFCLALVVWGKMVSEKYLPALFAPSLGLLLSVFSLLTILRNPAWESNERLLRTDVAISTESPKLNNDYGTALMEKAMQETDASARQRLLEEAFPYFEKALKQHPTYYDAYLAHGACAYYLGKYEVAVNSYRKAHELFPQDPKSTLGLKYSLQAAADDLSKKGNTNAAITAMAEAWQLQPDTLSATHLSFFFQQKNDQKAAAEWLQKALDLAPNDVRLLNYSQKK